jgi:hypothetical protein
MLSEEIFQTRLLIIGQAVKLHATMPDRNKTERVIARYGMIPNGLDWKSVQREAAIAQ